ELPADVFDVSRTVHLDRVGELASAESPYRLTDFTHRSRDQYYEYAGENDGRRYHGRRLQQQGALHVGRRVRGVVDLAFDEPAALGENVAGLVRKLRPDLRRI